MQSIEMTMAVSVALVLLAGLLCAPEPLDNAAAGQLVDGSNRVTASPKTEPQPGQSRNVELGEGIRVEMVWCPPGTFRMGSRIDPESVIETYGGSSELARYHFNEHPQHEVRLTQGFWIGAREVTNREFSLFVHDTEYETDAEREGWGISMRIESMSWEHTRGVTWRNPGWSAALDEPVVLVSWNDAAAFCSWLSQKTGEAYRLPTEAEWEYACRAGTTTEFWWGDRMEDGEGCLNGADETKLPSGAQWKYSFPFADGYWRVAPVGSFRPNPWRLYDMLGNVWEWCADWQSVYPNEATDDPRGPDKGSYRMFRGGSWNGEPATCRSACRVGSSIPSSRFDFLGFRVASSHSVSAVSD